MKRRKNRAKGKGKMRQMKGKPCWDSMKSKQFSACAPKGYRGRSKMNDKMDG